MNPGHGLGGLLLVVASGLPQNALATAPTLFSQPAYESPVRGEPGDLLLLAGYGFAATDAVMYAALRDTTQALTAPLAIPDACDASTGTAQIVSTLGVPDSLTIQLPTSLRPGTSYGLWVRNEAGEWSNGVRINDARPLWITPDTIFSSASMASLPRALRIVGRNLNPAPWAVTQIHLHGRADFVLPAANDNDPSTAFENYVAEVSLPESVPPGNYDIEVSRDGRSWIPVPEQTLTVFPDPPTRPTFDVSAFGGCLPDDGVDDTGCIASAITAANSAGGGTVVLGPGVWDMNYSGTLNTVGPVTLDGVLVPVGVDIKGAGAGSTIVQRGTSWNSGTVNFALQGNNTVQDITFRDANVYGTSSSAAPMVRLGVRWYFSHLYHASDPTTVSGVTLTRNVFDRPFVAIADGGMPIDHLLITFNEFGAYSNALALTGDGNTVNTPFRIDDSVIAFNRFKPGSYNNPSIGQGTMASQLGAAERLDFSNNTADGTATDSLYDPVNDPRGWRAAHFWSDRGNQSKVLIARNTATCTGDKAGDGEAIATDGSSFTIGLAAAQTVTAASSNTVSIAGPLLLQQNNKTLPGGYFTGHWVQIAEGPGKGQVRRIVSYPLDSTGQPVLPVTFTVSPDWDVVPQATSTLVVSREFWQVYVVDNLVDQRQPLCTKGNANKPAGGAIGFYAQTADSVMEGNKQFDTSGLSLGLKYSVPDPQLGTTAAVSLYSFIDIRNNIVNGEYDWPSACSWGGIQVSDGASPTAGYPPPVEGYGISISHNSVSRADGLHGGAISLSRGWFAGPSPSNWPLQEGNLVFANQIDSVSGPASQIVTGPLLYATSAFKQCPADTVARSGIRAGDITVWHAVLSGNSCTNVASGLADVGTGTQRVCPSSVANSCECPVPPPAP